MKIIKRTITHETDWSAPLPEPYHLCSVKAARGRLRWYGVDDTREWFDDDKAARAWVERRYRGCRLILSTMSWFETWTGRPDVVAISVTDLGGRPEGEGPVVGWIFGGVYQGQATLPPCEKRGCIPFDMSVWRDAINCLPLHC